MPLRPLYYLRPASRKERLYDCAKAVGALNTRDRTLKIKLAQNVQYVLLRVCSERLRIPLLHGRTGNANRPSTVGVCSWFNSAHIFLWAILSVRWKKRKRNYTVKNQWPPNFQLTLCYTVKIVWLKSFETVWLRWMFEMTTFVYLHEYF